MTGGRSFVSQYSNHDEPRLRLAVMVTGGGILSDCSMVIDFSFLSFLHW